MTPISVFFSELGRRPELVFRCSSLASLVIILIGAYIRCLFSPPALQMLLSIGDVALFALKKP